MSGKTPPVTIFKTQIEAEANVNELHKAGIDTKTSSILGKGYHSEDNVVGYYNMGNRVKYWGKLGDFWKTL